jgi:hypothetical protein
MYYEAVKSAFGCFPLEPPRELVIGDYVRITWGGRVLHLGNLRALLDLEVEWDEHVGDLEYWSRSVMKAETGAKSAPLGAEAKIMFSHTPGLYLKGTRRVRRARNLDTVYRRLAEADVKWSFLNRIVIETHFVEDAELYCSGGEAAELKATYSPAGTVMSIDAGAALDHHRIVHLPHVTGTIAFSPVRLIFGRALAATEGDPRGYDVEEMDVNDPGAYEAEAKADSMGDEA